MLRTFIQITSLGLTLVAAIFLAKGGLGLSARIIAELSSTKWDYNTGLIENLSQQRADTWAGVILLLAAFGFQMWNALWPTRWSDFNVHKAGAVYAVIFSILVGLCAYFLSNLFAEHTAREVKQTLEQSSVSPDQTTVPK